MSIPITLMYASVFAIFGMVLSFFAGSARGKSGISIGIGEPANMDLLQKVRVHQNFLGYVPMILIVMGGIEAMGGSTLFLYIVGDLLIIARIAHAIGLKHDKMNTLGRMIGAGGTALVTVAVGVYGLWLSANALLS